MLFVEEKGFILIYGDIGESVVYIQARPRTLAYVLTAGLFTFACDLKLAS